MKNWKSFNDECPRCGSEAEVFTDAIEDGYAFEDDDARCVECGLKGAVYVSCEEEGNAYVSWNDYED